MRRCTGLVTALVFLLAGTAYGQITSTAHDFSSETWNSSGEICVVCHTPHFADVSVSVAPLWNHDVTAATYTIYSSSTLDATVGQPAGISLLCLSCHDGTVALDSFGGATGTQQIAAGANVGGGTLGGTTADISDDHPISFTYSDGLASTDGGLHAPSTTNSGLGGTIQDDLLFADELECASCHDAHDDTNGQFLRKSNAASALCLTCHDK